jgi:hypothetical protein
MADSIQQKTLRPGDLRGITHSGNSSPHGPGRHPPAIMIDTRTATDDTAEALSRLVVVNDLTF